MNFILSVRMTPPLHQEGAVIDPDFSRFCATNDIDGRQIQQHVASAGVILAAYLPTVVWWWTDSEAATPHGGKES